VTVVREKDLWKITAPEALAADQVEAGAVLMQLRNLRAQAFLGDDASAIPRYLGTPDVKVTIRQEGAAAPITVLLAQSPERRGGQPTAYAGVVGQGPVVLVDARSLAGVTRTSLELRDRRMFADLQPKDVTKVRVKAGGQVAMLERSGDKDWKLVEPTKGAAKSAKVEDLLYMLRGLKWEEIAAPAVDAPARWGLDAPVLELTLFKADGGELGTLVLGKRDGERFFGRAASGPVYAIPARQLGELPKVPDDFKG